MTAPDFNLLVALDVLLAEASVAAAARRLNLSTSAMSRTLSRLREVTGDPILVRAGRHMVLTPWQKPPGTGPETPCTRRGRCFSPPPRRLTSKLWHDFSPFGQMMASWWPLVLP
ncbi:helix-turn-helix domain-containing protein [Enterobacter mori]